VTYGEIEARARRIAAWLLLKGVKPGDLINLVLTDRINTIATFLGITLVGAVAVMINPRSNMQVLLYKLNFTDAKFTIAESNLDLPDAVQIETVIQNSESVQPYVEYYNSDINDMAFILWTSGTTGHAKAVMHSHRSFICNVETNMASCPTVAADKIFCTSKLFFAFGINYSFMTTMWAGAEAYLEPGLTIPSNFRQNVRKYQPTKIYTVPFVYSQLVNDQQPIKTNAMCFSAGDKLSSILIDKWESLTGKRIYNMLGTSEVLNSILFNPSGTNSLGKATLGNEIRIVDGEGNIVPIGQVGYLEVKAPTIALGYYKDPEWTNKIFKEWVATGDVAYQDAELNYYYHQGRATDIIKIRGQWINPGDIEESISSHPDVEQCAVISKLGDNDIPIIEAFVVAHTNLNQADLKKLVLTKHEKYMCPSTFHLVNELPRTDTGKVQKYLLRNRNLAS
jgi:benzoate-CoA ligase